MLFIQPEEYGPPSTRREQFSHSWWAELHILLASWDIARRMDMPGDRWDNIIPSISNGSPCIRMIDMGSSKVIGDRLFDRAVTDDRRDIEEYTEYFLNS